MTDYGMLVQQLRALAQQESYYLPLLSNASALLYETLDRINWAGFYVMRDGRLILGPFQGKTACITIAPGKGVCGTAAASDQIQRVADVHAFPGHIACDSASASEIVIPLHHEGTVIGVLDIDSPVKDRFTAEDEQGLKEYAAELEKYLVPAWENE